MADAPAAAGAGSQSPTTAKSTQSKSSTATTITAASGQTVTFTLNAQNATSETPRILIDGKPIPLTSKLNPTGSLVLQRKSDGKRHWLRAELDDLNGEPVTLTNPIYINWKQ